MKIITVCIVSIVFFLSGQALAQRMSVSVPKGNIRSKPSTEAKVLWMSEKYYPVQVIEKKGPWIKFKDFEDDVGWIHESILDKTDTVITKKTKCNIRSGPGTDSEILFTVEKGVPFKVLKREKQWINIQHADGDTGWIHDGLVW